MTFPFPTFMPSSSAALTTITQQSSSTAGGSGATITAPASINAGDLIVLIDYAINATGLPTEVVPSGFTSISSVSSGKTRCILSYKKADGTEGSSSITGMSSNINVMYKVIVTFRGDVAATTITSNDPDGEATTGNPTAQTVTASGGSSPLVVIGGYASNNNVNPRTMSPAKDGEVGSSTVAYIAWKIYNSSPADVSVDMDDEGSAVHCLTSCYIEMI